MLSRILLFVHVMGAIMWLGGGWVFQIFTERAVAADDVERMKGLIEDGERLGKSYFGPLSFVVLGSGLGLTFSANWGFGRLFIIGGLVGLVLSAGIGGAFIGPTVGKIRAAFDGGAAALPEVKAGLRRLRNVGRADVVVTTVVVFLMTYKPGL